jgi:hypothetical protein
MATMPLAQKITDSILEGFPFDVTRNEAGNIDKIVVHAKNINGDNVTLTCTYSYDGYQTFVSEWVIS